MSVTWAEARADLALWVPLPLIPHGFRGSPRDPSGPETVDTALTEQADRPLVLYCFPVQRTWRWDFRQMVPRVQGAELILTLVFLSWVGGPGEVPARKLGWGVTEQLQDCTSHLWGAAGVSLPGWAKARSSHPPTSTEGPLPLHTEPRAQTQSLTTHRTRGRPQHRHQPPCLAPPLPLHPCSWCPSAGLAAWDLGQDSPNHRAFALAGPSSSNHSDLSLEVTSPDRSSWPKSLLSPQHVTLQA